jgi:hypothetical protein
MATASAMVSSPSNRYVTPESAERLFLGAGTAVRAVELAGLAVTAERTTADPVTGAQLGRATVPGLVGLHAPARPA